MTPVCDLPSGTRAGSSVTSPRPRGSSRTSPRGSAARRASGVLEDLEARIRALGDRERALACESSFGSSATRSSSDSEPTAEASASRPSPEVGIRLHAAIVAWIARLGRAVARSEASCARCAAPIAPGRRSCPARPGRAACRQLAYFTRKGTGPGRRCGERVVERTSSRGARPAGRGPPLLLSLAGFSALSCPLSGLTTSAVLLVLARPALAILRSRIDLL